MTVDAQPDYGTEFAPNRSKKNMRTLYFVLFLVMGLCLIPITIGLQDADLVNLNFPDMVGAGAFLFACCFGFFLLAHFLTSPWSVHYWVGKEGITLQAFSTKHSIPYTSIEGIRHISEKRSEEFALKGWSGMRSREMEELSASADRQEDLLTFLGKIWTAIKAQKRRFSPYKFLSVPIGYSSSPRSSVARTADLPCDTVLIVTKEGGAFFISPLDIPGFMNETKKYFSS